MSMITIGIDVGGTNTDAVLLIDNQIIATAKTQTTNDTTTGISSVISEVLTKANIKANDVSYIMIGTTHLLNATLQHQLHKVAIIRLGLPATTAIPPCTGWPKEMKDNVAAVSYIIEGGYEYTGKPINDLNKAKLREIAKELKDKNIKLVAISGVFSHVNPAQEKEAADTLLSINPDLIISLSHEMGGLGLIERENATIINTALLPIYHQVCNGIQATLVKLGLNNAKTFLSHNDGTLEAMQLTNTVPGQQLRPFLTLNAGPTNSMRGAAALAKSNGINDSVVVDIGGTSTDVGEIIDNLPLEENHLHQIAGITFNSPNIRTLSIALGGGSIIKSKEGKYSIGPESVGNRLKELAICYGGKELTVTDIAVLKNRIYIPTANKQSPLYPDQQTIDMLDDLLHKKLADVIIEVWSSSKEKPKNLLLVGGGSRLFDRDKLLKLLKGKITFIDIPENAEVANALGAEKGEICGTHTSVLDYQTFPRKEAIKIVTDRAIAKAIENGAGQDINVKSVYEQKIDYVPGSPNVIRVQASGSIRNKSDAIPPQTNKNNKEPRTISTSNRVSAEKILTSNFTSVSTAPRHQNVNTPPIGQSVNTLNIEALAIGCAFLGSGGGGDTRLAKLMVEHSLNNVNSITPVPLSSIPDDETVIFFGGLGSPSVLEDKIPSTEEIRNTMIAIGDHLKKPIYAVVILEIGGANGLLPLLAASKTVRIADADGMGRALPGINMTTAHIENGVKVFIAVMGNSTKTVVLEAKDAAELAEKITEEIVKMGCAGFIAYAPMDGKTAKKVCIPGTLSIAEKMGTVFLAAKAAGNDPIPALNEFLKTTEYEKIEELFNGRINDIIRKEEGGFSVGGLVINGMNENQVEIVFQNEFLLARKKNLSKTGNYFTNLVVAPHLIIVVDYETSLPISCGQLKFGQRVRVLTMNAPKKLLTEDALKVVGPQAYDLKRLVAILHGNPALTPSALYGKTTADEIDRKAKLNPPAETPDGQFSTP